MGEKYLHDNDLIHMSDNLKYVDSNNGDDNNAGSSYLPYKNLSKAFETISGVGKHIIIRHNLSPMASGGFNLNGLNSLVIEGEGLALVSVIPSMVNCSSVWFRNLVFMDTDTSQGDVVNCGDIHFENCSFVSNSTLFSLNNLTGNIYFKNCNLNGTISLDNINGHDDSAYKVEFENCQGNGILRYNQQLSGAEYYLKNSTFLYAENVGTADAVLNVDPLSGKSPERNERIPLIGNIEIAPMAYFGLDSLYRKVFMFTANADGSNNTKVIDSWYRKVLIDFDCTDNALIVELGDAPIGSEVRFKDQPSGTIGPATSDNKCYIRWSDGQGGFTYVTLTVPNIDVTYYRSREGWVIV